MSSHPAYARTALDDGTHNQIITGSFLAALTQTATLMLHNFYFFRTIRHARVSHMFFPRPSMGMT